jgi:glucose-6-phosphate isomerase
MIMNANALWQRYCKHLCVNDSIGLTLDIGRMNFADDFFTSMAPAMDKAYAAMEQLEAGAIANPDEQRMVGHYWLRDAKRAPDAELAQAIADALQQIKQFTADVHAGKIKPQQEDKFWNVLVIGIGGSALGPQFVADALGQPGDDQLKPYFFDNTDPDGMSRTLKELELELDATLCVVISKSGGTPETRNGMLVAKAAFEAAELDFAKHAVAVTGVDSNLDKVAKADGWLARFPMWDWVGGRTSQTCAVGLLPAALQGLDIDQLLAGAATCDEVTRQHDTPNNPAALLALMWYHATDGVGAKDMVVLPYKDRLLLLSRYLQQLVMESLGKKLDLDGNVVHQGIAVYGNKGSTDQHAYVQQLRDGLNNFFITFITTHETGDDAIEVEPGVTAGDFLRGFQLGTRTAMHEADRESMTLTVPRVDAFHVGVLIALYERAVGLYATLININAYHQPGVEAGKKAAASVLDLQAGALAQLKSAKGGQTAAQIAQAIDEPDAVETIYHVLSGLAANGRGVTQAPGDSPDQATFAVA